MTRLLVGPRHAVIITPRSIRYVILLLATLGGVIAAGCFDNTAQAPDGSATASPTPAARATAVPNRGQALGTPSPESLDAALAALIGSMQGGGTDPFSGPPESLPPDLRALLEALGIDLLLGAAVTEIGGLVAVEAVFSGSPAERAGLVVGDVITALDGRPLRTGAALRAAVQGVTPGETYALTLRGGGTTRLLDVERTLPEDSFWRSDMLRTLALGLMLANRPGALSLPPSLLGELLEETPHGLRVFAVFPGSPADLAGLRAGDYVLAIEGHPMRTLDDLNSLMASFDPIAAETEVTLRRDGLEMTMHVAFRIGGLFGAGTPVQAK